LNTKERVYYDEVAADPRFSSEAGQSPHRSVICLPIFSNRGQTFGAVYLASTYPFSQRIMTVLTLLCQQASISISNALLFRSVQTGTRENLKMITAQREALEAARKSREDALKATKVRNSPKSQQTSVRPLATDKEQLLGFDEPRIAHPIQVKPKTVILMILTMFSSFYGLLDLLSGTDLNAGQTEIGSSL
jgi:hypothetical protein